jgi:hypothetical protein
VDDSETGADVTKKLDPDVLALKRAVRALNGCTSRRMLKATLDYLTDRYVAHPTDSLPKHLKASRP